MMANKVVFLDLDGTVLNSKKEIPSSAIEAIERLKQKGVYVAIATGRAPFMFETLRQTLGVETYVSYNGQFVVVEGEVIHRESLDPNWLNRLERVANDREHPMVFMDDKVMRANCTYHPYIEESLGSLKFPHPPQAEKYYETNPVYQALLFCDEASETQYHSLGGPVRFVRWHRYSVDILPSEGSKAHGIQKVTDVLGINQENVYVFGDGLNDIEMIRGAETSVAMGNAVDEVKAAATYITSHVDDDGLKEGLEKVGLI